MRWLLIPVLLAVGCTAPENTDKPPLKARITYYHPYEDKWGWRNSCPETVRSVEGVTVAAEPAYGFGTVVRIPGLSNVVGDGTFVVQDRGSAITSRKASNGETPVFDVFVESPKKMVALQRNLPEFMDVIIELE